MGKHKQVERAQIFLGENGETIVRVVYWFDVGDRILRHTSFYQPGNAVAAEHLVELLTTVEKGQTP